MTVVSSKEFATKPTKYYNLAQNEQVLIKRGKNMFQLHAIVNVNEDDGDDDHDEYITMEELRSRVKEDVHQWYKEKYENCSISEGTAIS